MELTADKLSVTGGTANTAVCHGEVPARLIKDKRPTLLHFTPSIGGGGAEAMLNNLVQAMHGGAWRMVVVAVDGRKWPKQAEMLRANADRYYDLESNVFLRASTLLKLRRIILKEKPDVVHTWMHHADFVGGVSAWLAGVKNVVWSIHCREIFRSPGDSDLKMKVFRTALAAACRFIPRRIISCSAAAIKDHEAIGYQAGKMTWVPNGINTERFVPDAKAGFAMRRELGLATYVPLIGFVGRFHSVKQIDLFFRAAALLQKRVPNAHFVLAGGGEKDLDEPSRKALEALPRKDQVRFVQFCPEPEKLYPALSLFTLCSRSEACPMTILEAMACGVPCVVTDVGDSALLLGGLGHVVPSGDAEALAAAWEQALTASAHVRAEACQQARRRVEEAYSISHTAKAYQTIYETLLPKA